MNSFSSIISSFQVCIRILASSSLSVMAGEGVAPVNPEITVPVVPTQPGGTPPVTNDLAVMEAELMTYRAAMLEAAQLKKVKTPPALLEDQEESDDPIVLAKQQLKVMTSLHNVCVNQFFAHETSLKAQMVETKAQETCTNLLLHRLGLVQHEVQRLADHLEKDLDLGASTLDHVQVSIQSFGDKFGNLSDTLKDIVSSHRARYATEDEMRKKILSEISGAKEFLQHIRSNTQSVSKSFQNLVWETQEMRCGGKDAASGTVSTQGGSLIAALNVTMENQGTLILEHLNKMGLEIKDAVEKGTDPHKSLKRKFEDDQQAEFQRQKEELEQAKLLRQQQERREQVFHPSTGQVMWLTEGERRELYKSLHLMKEGDVPMGAGTPAPTATAAHPPAVPPVGSFHPGFPHPLAPAPGFPPSPGCGSATGYTPPPIVAPATLPVIGSHGSHPGPGKSA